MDASLLGVNKKCPLIDRGILAIVTLAYCCHDAYQ